MSVRPECRVDGVSAPNGKVLELDRRALERVFGGKVLNRPGFLAERRDAAGRVHDEFVRHVLAVAESCPAGQDGVQMPALLNALSERGVIDPSDAKAVTNALSLYTEADKLEDAEVVRLLRDEKPDTRPVVVVREEHNAVAAEAQAALLADPDAQVFVRSRTLVRVARDSGVPRGGLRRPEGAPFIEALSVDALIARLDKAARWVKRGGGKDRPVRPPEWVARAVMAADSWDFPYLVGVVEAPTMRPDGELLDRPGYDEATGLLLKPSGDFPAVPSRPSADKVREAVAALSEPFADFPFVAESDLAAAVAATLSLVARHAVEGCVPLFAFRATAPGTGKTLLADAVTLIGTGRGAACMTLPEADDELRKAVLSVALDGTAAVLLDNVDRPLGSHTLAGALTLPEWTGRLLGRSQMVRAPLRTVWLATGNGLTFKGDLGRRVVPCDLDARVEHPEDRTGFRHEDLLGFVRERRARLVGAALTVLRGFHVAGRPRHGCGPRMGSFEAWDDLVRGSLVWAGFGDPFAGHERIRRDDDEDLAALRAALAAWVEAFGSRVVTAADAVGEATKRAERGEASLRDALLGLTPNREKLDSRPLGNALRRVRGRVCGGCSFGDAGERHKVALWRVEGPGGGLGSSGGLVPYLRGREGREYSLGDGGKQTPVTPRTPTDSPEELLDDEDRRRESDEGDAPATEEARHA